MHRLASLRERNMLTWRSFMLLFILEDLFASMLWGYHYWAANDLTMTLGLPVALLFVGMLMLQPSLRKQWDMLLLVAFVAWYAVVLVLNHVLTDTTRLQGILGLVRLYGVYYAVAYVLRDVKKERWIHAPLILMIVICTILHIIAVVLVIREQVYFSPYTEQFIGINLETSLRLFIFQHPNSAGAAAMLTILSSIYLCLTSKRWLVRVCYMACIVPAILVISLTNSRTSLVALSVGLGALSFVWVRSRLYGKNPKLSWVAGIACALAVATITYTVVMPLCQVISNAAVQANLRRKDLVEAMDDMGNRTYIWKAAFQTLSEQPGILLRGTTLEKVGEVVSNTVGGEFPHLHNLFLQVLVATGLPGFLLMLLFLVILGWHAVRLLLDTSDKTTLATRFLPSILMACMVVSLLESMFLIQDNSNTRIFLLVAGYVMVLSRRLRLQS